ncbi:MAG: SAM-dependent methyltransferase [Rubrivivax sp.]|nr:SAM-dependent methyltransferase [Rubrivivax sp.]
MSDANPSSASAASGPTAAHGQLVLVPNALDFGATPQELAVVLPLAVLQWAARLQHWVVEDAKSARAFLKRVHEVVPLQAQLQALSIVELPRPTKGRTAPVAPRAQAADPEIARLLSPALAGHDVGLLSEAGLPAVADPGAAIVAAAHELGVRVLPLPGPSSLLLALAASGLDGQSFAFVGYLPQEPAARCERIRELEGLSRRLRQTQIFIETPYRNAALMGALLDCAAPATRLSVSVALTLPGGWSRTATVAEWRRPSAGPRADLPDRLPAVFLLQA